MLTDSRIYNLDFEIDRSVMYPKIIIFQLLNPVIGFSYAQYIEQSAILLDTISPHWKSTVFFIYLFIHSISYSDHHHESCNLIGTFWYTADGSLSILPQSWVALGDLLKDCRVHSRVEIILFLNPSFVMWSLYEMFKIIMLHLISRASMSDTNKNKAVTA